MSLVYVLGRRACLTPRQAAEVCAFIQLPAHMKWSDFVARKQQTDHDCPGYGTQGDQLRACFETNASELQLIIPSEERQHVVWQVLTGTRPESLVQHPLPDNGWRWCFDSNAATKQPPAAHVPEPYHPDSHARFACAKQHKTQGCFGEWWSCFGIEGWFSPAKLRCTRVHTPSFPGFYECLLTWETEVEPHFNAK